MMLIITSSRHRKGQKKNYDIRHSVNKTKLEIGDMVVKENRVNVG